MQQGQVITIPNFGENENILKEKSLIEPYLRVINNNKHLFKGKKVLQLNCGVGLLMIHSLRCGATHVYGTKSNHYTKQVMVDNEIKEDQFTLFESGIQDIKQEFQVDIIISQWFGNLLLFNSTIEDVIYARDKHLIKDGIILPDKGNVYLQTLQDNKYKTMKFSYWDSVYGVKMSCIKEWFAIEPLFESVKQSQINSDPYLIYSLDMNTCTIKDLTFSHSYLIRINDNQPVTGLIGSFDVTFSKCHLPITIAMKPILKPYIKSCIFYFKQELQTKKGQKIKGSFAALYNKDYLDIKLSCNFQNQQQIQYFKLN